MQPLIIGDYEVTYTPELEPALVIHQVVRGIDAAQFDAQTATELGALLAVQQKRIRELGGYRLLLGAAGDLALYRLDGRRTCYLNPDQASQLARLLMPRA